MKKHLKELTNFSFGSTSGIITNMSLIIGLGASNLSKTAIIGSLLVIAVADNISDSLGVHMYKESESSGTKESVIATIGNFTARLIVSLSFVLIMLLFPIGKAEIITLVWGLLLLVGLSYLIARRNKDNPFIETTKHVVVALIVIAASRYAGSLIKSHF
ncbi:MAG: hypothetical protein NT145_08440 [Elusimicrobia bacterium]|nr:hypothetical protein [Elusimicrobiota bacterium]